MLKLEPPAAVMVSELWILDLVILYFRTLWFLFLFLASLSSHSCNFFVLFDLSTICLIYCLTEKFFFYSSSFYFNFFHSKKWWLLLNSRLFNLILLLCFLWFLLLWQSNLMIQIISHGTFRFKFFLRVMAF